MARTAYPDSLKWCRVPLIDARDWCPDGDFADGFHPLPPAADRFSERFRHEALSRLLRGGPRNPARGRGTIGSARGRRRPTCVA